LLNPQGGALWVHTTDTPAAAFLTEGFRFSGGPFYIAAGGDLSFGDNVLFLEYAPTKLFDPESAQDRAELRACLEFRVALEDAQSELRAFARHTRFDFDSAADVFAEVEHLMESGNFQVYEWFSMIRPCLRDLGYTAYYENEGVGFAPRDIHIVVLPSDFRHLRIVAAFDSRKSRSGLREVDCPTCSRSTPLRPAVDLAVSGVFGSRVMCPACARDAHLAAGVQRSR
jgi:hypothetical protein